MTRDILFATVLLIVWPALTAAQQATLVDDAHVSAQRPNRSFGDNEALQISPVERAFLRFSLEVPAGTAGSHVGQATLKLFVRNVRTTGQIGIHRVTGAWSERNVNDATAPAVGAQEGEPVVVAQAHERGWVTVDVTQLVRDWLDNIAINDGVAFVGIGTTDIVLDSKENTATGHEPVLEIVLNHAATADDAARLGGANAMSYVRADDVRLSDARAPTPDSAHYVQNTPSAQDAQFNVANGTVRGNLTVLGALNAPNFNVGGSFIQNRMMPPQPGASFNIAGDGTVGGTLTGATVNAATQFNVAGQRVLSVAAPGSANLFLGLEAGTPAAAFANTFIGSRAGMRATTGGLNTFVGWDAGRDTTEGCCNSFFGNLAGERNTTGFANTFVGGGAGGKHVDGFRNTLIGDLAGHDLFEGTALETGNRNTFVGSVSGRRITTGSFNTFVGVDTTGTANIQFASAFGSNAKVETNDTIVIGKAAGEYYGVPRPADTVIIPGNLNVAGALSLNIVEATTQFNIAGQRVVGADPSGNVAVGYQAGLGAGGANTSIGFQAGQSVTGRANVFLGNRSGRFTAGSSNTFLGSIAGEVHAAGDENTFVGDGAGGSLTGGSENSFFGVDAGRGRAGSAPNRNSFFGTLAGRNSHSDFANAAFGFRAGFANEAGVSNAFFGAWSGENTIGSYNAFFGTQAGQQNSTGVRNAFFGTEAGSHNQDGYENVFIGALAGVLNTSGVWNTFVGAAAGFNNQGSHNAFFGTNAGRRNTAGSHNSFFGRNAGYSSTASGNAFFGAGAGELTTTGGRNAFFGAGAGSMNVTGADNVFVGENAGRGNAAGNHNTLLGSHAEVGAGDLTFATALGAGAIVDASNTVVLGRAADTVRIPGSLSIGGTFTAAAFTGNGTGLTDLDASNITGGTLATARLGLIPTANIADGAVTAPKIAAGQVVKALNGFTDEVILAAGANISIAAAGNTLTIAASGGGAGNAILNQTTPQAGANFNIDGVGSANALNAVDAYQLGGNRILAAAGFDNLFAGVGAGRFATGGFNAFFGAGAGASNTWANSNAFFGAHAGSATIGPNNSFFGTQAGEHVTTGIGNSYFGDQAGQFNDVGSSNSFFGRRSGYRNKANGNSFFGHDAGRENTTGVRNSYFGVAAGQNNPEGSDNSIFGYDAGASFSPGASGNSLFGALAGLGNRGSSNAFFGWEAGRQNDSGSGNTFVGTQAGRSNSFGDNNTYVGFQAGGFPGLTNATALGANAFASRADSLVLGNNADVGIGTSSPKARLDVQGGHILVGSPGQGIILKSPDGATCLLLSADNAGALTSATIACP
jgi:hypothetical protein